MARHETEMRRQRRELLAVLNAILEANDRFRAQLPEGWEGDPVNDACEEARAFLKREGL